MLKTMIMKIILFNSAIHEICSMFIIDVLLEIMIYHDKMKTIYQYNKLIYIKKPSLHSTTLKRTLETFFFAMMIHL
jgi:hypothetical protein